MVVVCVVVVWCGIGFVCWIESESGSESDVSVLIVSLSLMLIWVGERYDFFMQKSKGEVADK